VLLKKRPATPTYLSTGCVNAVVADGCTMMISKDECRHQPLFFSTPTRFDASTNTEGKDEVERKGKEEKKKTKNYDVVMLWMK